MPPTTAPPLLPGNVYRNFRSTPTSFNNPGFYTLPNVVFGMMVVNRQSVGSATFTLTDNQLGDGGDPTVGLIVDPSGPGVPATAAPALSAWTMSMVAIGLTVLGVWNQRRRLAQQ